MLKLTEINRNESLQLAEPNFKSQESKIIEFLKRNGSGSSHDIYRETGIFLTDVRRAMTNLEQKKVIIAFATKFNTLTQRNNSIYMIANGTTKPIDKKRKKIEKIINLLNNKNISISSPQLLEHEIIELISKI